MQGMVALRLCISVAWRLLCPPELKVVLHNQGQEREVAGQICSFCVVCSSARHRGALQCCRVFQRNHDSQMGDLTLAPAWRSSGEIQDKTMNMYTARLQSEGLSQKQSHIAAQPPGKAAGVDRPPCITLELSTCTLEKRRGSVRSLLGQRRRLRSVGRLGRGRGCSKACDRSIAEPDFLDHFPMSRLHHPLVIAIDEVGADVGARPNNLGTLVEQTLHKLKFAIRTTN